MNILLTGATGYIGRRLQRKLAADDSVRLRLLIRNARKVQADIGIESNSSRRTPWTKNPSTKA